MPGKQAKILSDQHIEDLLFFADNTRQSDRNRVIVLLSMKAGLRAAEIAKLTWEMVVGPTGEIGIVIELRDHAAKMGSGRTIPIHPQLQQPYSCYGNDNPASGPVIRSERGGPMKPLSIVDLVRARLSGSRVGRVLLSFGTAYLYHARRSRSFTRAGGSLSDVQLLAGHRSIQTTQRYIDGDSDAQRRLVSLI